MPDLPLKLGSTGDDVKRVQRSIVRDGYRSAANDLGLNGAEDVARRVDHFRFVIGEASVAKLVLQ